MAPLAIRWLSGICASAALCALLAAPALAREGLYVGGGVAAQATDGDLDGKKAYGNSAGTRAYLVGKLDTGYGLDVNVGYGFNRYFSVDFLGAVTNHTATHRAVNFDSDAQLMTLLLGGRLNYPLSATLELFGRANRALSYVTYSDYALHGNIAAHQFDSKNEVTFAGDGFGLGGGAEWFLKDLGFGASYNWAKVSYSSLSEKSGSSKKLKKNLVADTNLLAVTVTYNFKK